MKRTFENELTGVKILPYHRESPILHVVVTNDGLEHAESTLALVSIQSVGPSLNDRAKEVANTKHTAAGMIIE